MNMDKKYIKRLSSNELYLLGELFDYNDINEMMTSNSRKIENGEIDIFGLFLDSGIAGEIRVMYKNEDTLFAVKGKRAYLYAFRILEDFQGKGYGKYLLKQVIGQLVMNGYSEFTVGVEDNNEVAKHIYNSLGFNELIARKQEEYQGDKYEYSLYLKVEK